jgi:pimeloyl-ACP methyl ester carboxylesterase
VPQTPYPSLLEIDVAGHRIAYRRAGDGPAVVLLHGAMSDSREWRRQLDGLSRDFTVVAWDAPGCGRSADPPATFRLGDYADVLGEFIAALHLERPHVVGLSFGAGLALELVRRRPASARSLVLASAYAGWAGSLPPGDVCDRLRRVLESADRPPRELVEEMLPTFVGSSATPEAMEELAAIAMDFHPAGVRAMAHSFAEADLRAVLPSIAVRTLLIRGEQDARVPPDVTDALAAAIPRCELVVLSGAGHQVNVESPVAFTAAVRSFLVHGEEPRRSPAR